MQIWYWLSKITIRFDSTKDKPKEVDNPRVKFLFQKRFILRNYEKSGLLIEQSSAFLTNLDEW